MNRSFPNRWSFSYLKSTKYVTNIIAEPKYKYGHQEQVTVRNHNKSLLPSSSLSWPFFNLSVVFGSFWFASLFLQVSHTSPMTATNDRISTLKSPSSKYQNIYCFLLTCCSIQVTCKLNFVKKKTNKESSMPKNYVVIVVSPKTFAWLPSHLNLLQKSSVYIYIATDFP